jgi:hypothetical protein
VASWRVGQRDLGTAYDFMHDLADRLSRRVQLMSDGFRVYLEAIESAFNLDVGRVEEDRMTSSVRARRKAGQKR